MNGVVYAWMIDSAIVTGRAWRREHRPPIPAEFAAGFIVFGGLAALASAPQAQTFATVLAWGVVVATVTNLDTKTGALRNLRPAGTPAASTTGAT